MLVIVDANVIMKDAILRDRKWRVAKDAVDADRLRLVLPEVARLEAIGGYRRDHEDKIRQVKGVIRKSTNRAKAAAESLLRVYADEVDQYESILNTRLHEIGFLIAEPPDRTHIDMTERAINRLAPFDESGGGYRDTLLWLTALEQVDEPPFENLVLVSDDSVFTKRSSDLTAELRRETGAELTVLRSFASLELPGEYESGQFDFSSLHIHPMEIETLIKDGLPGLNITRWSPPGPDHADVRRVGRVDLLDQTADVKKRYGSEIYELSVEAIADIDAAILIIDEGFGDDVDFSEMSARWNLHVRWRGETAGHETRIIGEGTVEVLGLEERRKPPR
ncbi:PIN domain-containing protein [Herbiconiux solani]|uniref:PIN domain-containing protein n=1 Tax=Herbiconiux solani TaxID=661329 RepID=UPI0008258385|nr:PIN domain-containing protein [Herbiconiux solani]